MAIYALKNCLLCRNAGITLAHLVDDVLAVAGTRAASLKWHVGILHLADITILSDPNVTNRAVFVRVILIGVIELE